MCRDGIEIKKVLYRQSPCRLKLRGAAIFLPSANTSAASLRKTFLGHDQSVFNLEMPSESLAKGSEYFSDGLSLGLPYLFVEMQNRFAFLRVPVDFYKAALGKFAE